MIYTHSIARCKTRVVLAIAEQQEPRPHQALALHINDRPTCLPTLDCALLTMIASAEPLAEQPTALLPAATSSARGWLQQEARVQP